VDCLLCFWNNLCCRYRHHHWDVCFTIQEQGQNRRRHAHHQCSIIQDYHILHKFWFVDKVCVFLLLTVYIAKFISQCQHRCYCLYGSCGFFYITSREEFIQLSLSTRPYPMICSLLGQRSPLLSVGGCWLAFFSYLTGIFLVYANSLLAL